MGLYDGEDPTGVCSRTSLSMACVGTRRGREKRLRQHNVSAAAEAEMVCVLYGRSLCHTRSQRIDGRGLSSSENTLSSETDHSHYADLLPQPHNGAPLASPRLISAYTHT